MYRLSSRPLALALTGAALAIAAHASFTNPYTPSFRGQAHTQYAYWESFASAVGARNSPTDPLSTTFDAALVQLTPGAILTGSGNIYQFQAPPVFVLNDSVPADLLEVALQVSTWGNELDYGAVELEYVTAGGALVALPATQITELARYPAMGFNVETLFTWDLGSVADSITNYTLHFHGAQANLSLDAVTLDVRHDVATTSYCTAKLNSLGCTPAISWSGTPSLGGGAFTISAQNLVANAPGQLFYGTNGRANVPFQGGTLCVAAPRRRTPLQSAGGSSGCSGAFSFDFAAWLASNSDPALGAGTLVDAQFWGRDSADPFGSSLSDALEFVIAP